MTVRIPSDLVVDVMKAADPSAVQLAAVKLRAAAKSEATGTMFTDALKALREPRSSGDMVVDVMRAAAPADARQAAQRLAGLSPTANDAYAHFESFMLRDAFEEMLPKAETGAFGEGFAGGVWRSMAAEQFASIFTAHGGLGIAEMMRSKAGVVEQDASAGQQWPYYRAPAISAYMPPAA